MLRKNQMWPIKKSHILLNFLILPKRTIKICNKTSYAMRFGEGMRGISCGILSTPESTSIPEKLGNWQSRRTDPILDKTPSGISYEKCKNLGGDCLTVTGSRVDPRVAIQIEKNGSKTKHWNPVSNSEGVGRRPKNLLAPERCEVEN